MSYKQNSQLVSNDRNYKRNPMFRYFVVDDKDQGNRYPFDL